MFMGVRHRSITRCFRLTQPYWVYVYACGGSYHLPPLSPSLVLSPISPLPHLYLCSASVPQSSFAGWRETHTHAFLLHLLALLSSPPLPLTCCLFLAAAYASSRAAAASPGTADVSAAALLPCYSSSIVPLVQLLSLLSFAR